ncbi:MAG: nickel-dependent hydrogenase large subunit [Candidatus Aenigmarchaeota archaeon]|nr:nickel-dependent hydrogenase large subunit [Candidatus Aenigmarchaeota archaeon]
MHEITHDYTLPIGPQHPTLKEPMCLRISLDGNTIKDVKIRMGYTHKGIEKLMEGKNPDSALYTSQRICGICSSAHENAYCMTVEGILKYDPEERVKLIRALMMELERLHSHILWLGVIAHEIGYETMFMYFWREREKIIDVFEKITGGRVHHNFNKIKTVRFDLEEGNKKFIIDRIDSVEKSIANYMKDLTTDRVIASRLRGVGIITKADAKRYSLVGPCARASGVRCDIRKFDPPFGIYRKLDFKEIITDNGDSFDRTYVRVAEVLESCKLVRQILNMLPSQQIPKFVITNVPDGEGLGRVEAPRGELFYYMKFKDGKIERVKMRTPTFAYLKIAEKILLERKIGDIPVIMGSLDPCFSCLERVLVAKDGKVESNCESEFRRKYVCTR